MAFVLPNGTVVDPERDDRAMILSQLSQRRQLAQQDKSSARNSALQSQVLGAEMESQRADREQTDRLANSEMAQRERMATAAESALTTRLDKESERARDLFNDEQLRVIDAEEEQASGVAKRLNALLAEHDRMKPDAAKDPEKFQEWQIGRARIRAQIPVNYEGALFESNGVWKVDPGFFKVKRSRYLKPAKAAGESSVAAAIAGGSKAANPTDESLWRAMTKISGGAPAGPVFGPSVPSTPVAPVVPVATPVDPSSILARAISGMGSAPTAVNPMSGRGGIVSLPGMGGGQSTDIGRALQMIAQAMALTGNAGFGPAVGAQMFDQRLNNSLPAIGKYQAVGFQ
jgi:hypothetical protein